MDFYRVILTREFKGSKPKCCYKTTAYNTVVLAENEEEIKNRFLLFNNVKMSELIEKARNDSEIKDELYWTYRIHFTKNYWYDGVYTDSPTFRLKKYNPYIFSSLEVKKTSVSMKEALEFDSEDVIKYLKERGLTVNLNK
jgi:hypothetical protein